MKKNKKKRIEPRPQPFDHTIIAKWLYILICAIILVAAINNQCFAAVFTIGSSDLPYDTDGLGIGYGDTIRFNANKITSAGAGIFIRNHGATLDLQNDTLEFGTGYGDNLWGVKISGHLDDISIIGDYTNHGMILHGGGVGGSDTSHGCVCLMSYGSPENHTMKNVDMKIQGWNGKCFDMMDGGVLNNFTFDSCNFTNHCDAFTSRCSYDGVALWLKGTYISVTNCDFDVYHSGIYAMSIAYFEMSNCSLFIDCKNDMYIFLKGSFSNITEKNYWMADTSAITWGDCPSAIYDISTEDSTCDLCDFTLSGTYAGAAKEDTFWVEIVNVAASPDTFRWMKSAAGTWDTLPIPTDSSLLNNGVYAKFTNQDGHTLGDDWMQKVGYECDSVASGICQINYTQTFNTAADSLRDDTVIQLFFTDTLYVDANFTVQNRTPTTFDVALTYIPEATSQAGSWERTGGYCYTSGLSTGITVWGSGVDVEIHDNIFIAGIDNEGCEQAIALNRMAGSAALPINVYNNYAELHRGADDHYGGVTTKGMKNRWQNKHINIYDNEFKITMHSDSGDHAAAWGSHGEGIYILSTSALDGSEGDHKDSFVVYERNHVEVLALDAASSGSGLMMSVKTGGGYDFVEAGNIIRNNYWGSNDVGIDFGNNDGGFARTVLIQNDTIESIGTTTDYHTFESGLYNSSCINNTVRDMIYLDEAIDTEAGIDWTGGSPAYGSDISYERTLDVYVLGTGDAPLEGVEVFTINVLNDTLFDTTDANGLVNPITRYDKFIYFTPPDTTYNNFTIAVTYGGADSTSIITVDHDSFTDTLRFETSTARTKFKGVLKP